MPHCPACAAFDHLAERAARGVSAGELIRSVDSTDMASVAALLNLAPQEGETLADARRSACDTFREHLLESAAERMTRLAVETTSTGSRARGHLVDGAFNLLALELLRPG